MKRMKFERKLSRRSRWVTHYVPLLNADSFTEFVMSPPPPHPRLRVPVIYVKTNPNEKPKEFNVDDWQGDWGKTECPGCGWMVDEDMCHCGAPIDDTHPWDHSPVPMGCTCGYHDAEKRRRR